MTPHLRIPAAPMKQAISGRTAFSTPGEGYLISVIREGIARELTELKQARLGLGQAGWSATGDSEQLHVLDQSSLSLPLRAVGEPLCTGIDCRPAF